MEAHPLTPRPPRPWAGLATLLLTLALSACGGGGGGDAGTASDGSASATIGVTGGDVGDGSGAQVTVPAGALSTDTTIRIARDATGAPALPTGMTAAGSIYAITPHGGSFAQPVQVRIPRPNVTLQPNQALRLAKAEPGGDWVVLGDASVDTDALVASVDGFSYFAGMIINYPVPIVQAQPFAVTSSAVTCTPLVDGCKFLFGPTTLNVDVRTNGGQLPAECLTSTGRLLTWLPNEHQPGVEMPASGGTASVSATPKPSIDYLYVDATCESAATPGTRITFMHVLGYPATYEEPVAPPRLVARWVPDRIDVVAGQAAQATAVFSVGTVTPTVGDQTVVQWQRSDDGGASWTTVGTSYQSEGDPKPFGAASAWRNWSVSHGFVATAADQGALLRANACYTPSSAPNNPCALSHNILINVVQQSALPALTQLPQSLLVRTGQTASFSAAATGTPAPTLQWQMRDANGAGAWADAGTPGTSFTTPVLGLADNGRQVRVVASNALGSAASPPVTVSVSDVDVAPAIVTAPTDLTVGAGSDAVFAVDATGTAALSYQWLFNGTPITGANAAVLRLLAVDASAMGNYRVTVSNSAGQVTSVAVKLTVNAAAATPALPVIQTQPAATTATAGGTATFAVTAAGSSQINYQWLRNGVAITGATASSFTTPTLASADSGAVYSVVVYNGAGIVFSGGAVLTVTAASTVSPLSTSPDGKLSALNAHACAVGADAHAYCWGNGANGELGNGVAAFSASPVQVSGPSQVVFVAAGGSGSCAISGLGQLWCWGAVTPAMNLGATPVALQGVSDAGWVAVGTDHACYVDSSAQVLCWGDNSAGQLGDGTLTARSTPVRVHVGGGLLTGIVSVSAGSRYSCAVGAGGETWCWGADTSGQARPTAQRLQKQTGSQSSDFYAGGPVGAGLHHACAIDLDTSTPACWGSNSGGQLGDGTFNAGDVAVDIGSSGRARFAAGSSHTCALGNLDVVCWGTAAMGNGNPPETLTSPQAAGKVASLSLQAHTVNALAAGDRFTCALRTSGDVQCWGLNNAGQTGTGSASDTVLVLTPASTTAGAVFWKP